MLGVGHTFSIDVIGTIIDRGETPNTVNKDSLLIKDASGKDVTNNYEVMFVLGELVIT